MSNSEASAPKGAISVEEARAYSLAPMTPQVFGRYTLIGKLGHGGMAEVLLAVQDGKAGFRKLVVLKRLHAQLESQPGFIEMFLDEARLAAQLDHPNCVQTLEVGEYDGQHFLAMEYLEGQGLERLLRSSAHSGVLIPIPTAVRIIADALEGLAYAHELTDLNGRPLGVVHRDVSPQNIFVTYAGAVKLLDFGIAKAESNVVQTRTGVVKGKYAYIAPEQALAHDVDQRADLWSMGVVLWECLTARRLFKSTNELATLHETLHAKIVPPSEYNRSIPPELDAIVLRALERDVDERYQTAAEFKEALEDWGEMQAVLPTRRAIAHLMRERFDEALKAHREKLAACVKSVDGGGAIRIEGATPSNPPPGISAEGVALRSVSSETPPPRISVTPPPRISLTPTPLMNPPEVARSTRTLGWALLVTGAVSLMLVVALQQGMFAFGPPEIHATPLPAAPGEAPRSFAHEPTEVEPPAEQPVEPEALAEAPVAPDPDSEADSTSAEASPRPQASRPNARSRRGGASSHSRSNDAPSSSSTASSASTEFGYLSLVTSPWTNVIIDGRPAGETPLVRERLSAGRHRLRLVNEQAGIAETYEVEIRPGETVRRRLGLR